MTPPPGAVEAARRGWAVFPTRPGGKQPREGMSWPKIACADPARVSVARWRPGEGYGIAAKRSGLVILDLDRPKPGYVLPEAWQAEPGIVDGADVLATLAVRAGVTSLPCTFTVRTPSGGQHLYFTALDSRLIGNRPAGPMIDVRGGGDGDGGYVVGPGTVIGGRAYEITDDQDPVPLPAWIADILDPPAEQMPYASDGRHRLSRGRDGVPAYGRLRGVVEHVLSGPPGDRNGRLYWSACRAAEMIAAGQLERDAAEQVLLQAAIEAGLQGGETEARRTIASGLQRGAA